METKEVRRVSIYASSLVYKNRGKEMKELLKPVFRSILSKREIVLFLICMIYPLITALVSIFQAGIASYAEGEQISFIMFWQIIVHTQWQLTIPTLLLSYSVMSVFRNEISSKRLFLFKDILQTGPYPIPGSSCLQPTGFPPAAWHQVPARAMVW